MERTRLHVAQFVRSTTLAVAARTGDPFARLMTLPPGADHGPLHAAVRARGPLARSPLGTLVTADHAVASAVLRSPHASARIDDTDLGLLGRLIAPIDDIGTVPHPVGSSLVMTDAPDHTRLRRLIARGFTPSRLAAHRAAIRTVADELLDALPADRPVDLVAGFARPLPMRVICSIMGVPATETDRFFAWGDALANTLGGIATVEQNRAVRAAAADISAFFADLVTERRAHPGDDLVSALVDAEDADALTEQELLVTLSFLLIAGFETTVNLLGRGTEALLADRPQLDRVAGDLTLVPACVEEGLRHVSPVRFTQRRMAAALTVDTPEGGVTVPAGAVVTVLLGAAARDPRVFGEPDRFDVDRPNARDHLAFSAGPHYCLGAALARMEAEEAWGALLGRFPRLRQAGPAVPTDSTIINGLAHLPVVLAARAGDRGA